MKSPGNARRPGQEKTGAAGAKRTSTPHVTVPGAFGGRVVRGHEPSTWLRQTVGEFVRKLRRSGVDLWGGDTHVVASVHGARPGSREDFTCDRCRAYRPAGLRCAAFQAAPLLSVAYGLCDDCHAKEHPGE